MAVGYGVRGGVGSGNYFLNTSVLPTDPSYVTFSCWFHVKTLPPSGADCILEILGGNQLKNGIFINTSGVVYGYDNTNGASSNLVTVSAGDWIYVAVSNNGSTATYYASKNGAASAVASLALASSADSSYQMYLLDRDNGGYYPTDGYVCNARIWNVALTQAELDAERFSATAVKTASLLSDIPLSFIGEISSGTTAWTSGQYPSPGMDSPYVVHGQIVQGTITANNGSGVATWSATLNNVASGNSLLVLCYCNDFGTGFIGCSDSQGSYTQIGSQYSFGSGLFATAYLLQNANSGTHTASVSVSDGTQYSTEIVMLEISGLTASASDGFKANYNASTSAGTDSASSGNLTTTANGDLLVGWCMDFTTAGDGERAGTSFTPFAPQGLEAYAALGRLGFIEYRTQTTAGAVAATFTQDGSGSGTFTALIALKSGSAGGTTTITVTGQPLYLFDDHLDINSWFS